MLPQQMLIMTGLLTYRRVRKSKAQDGLNEIDSFDLVTDNGFAINSLNTDSNGNLTLVINGDADQSPRNGILLSHRDTKMLSIDR